MGLVQSRSHAILSRFARDAALHLVEIPHF